MTIEQIPEAMTIEQIPEAMTIDEITRKITSGEMGLTESGKKLHNIFSKNMRDNTLKPHNDKILID